MSGSLVAALVSLRLPYRDFVQYNPLPRGTDASVFLVLFIVFFLAYALNPTESSFRVFLTELSFRHHLSRLEDPPDDRRRAKSVIVDNNGHSDSPAPFQFASKASLSLRTPRHTFRSFGIFTIAAVPPLPRLARAGLHVGIDREGSVVSDTWFIGAFGRWWRAGATSTWSRGSRRSSGDDSWTSGVLSIASLDNSNGHHVLPFAHRKRSLLEPSKAFPPRLRSRDGRQFRNGTAHRRSATPPPLPKSASLPLHSKKSDRTPQTTHPTAPSSAGVAVDQSPKLADLRRQISAVTTAVAELRSQCTDVQNSAAESRASLQSELDTVKERRRLEDLAKSELKSRTKMLDDSKRTAEGARRDAEKRLKAAHLTRDEASQRIQRLEKEIEDLRTTMGSDKQFIEEGVTEMADARSLLQKSLEDKKKELKVAEDVISALGLRAKELEEKLSTAKSRLALLQERNQDPIVHPQSANSQWTPLIAPPAAETTASPGLPSPSPEPDSAPSRPSTLSLGSISNFNPSPHSSTLPSMNSQYSQPLVPDSGFSSIDEDVLSVPPTARLSFPSSGQLLIPSGLINSLDASEGPTGTAASPNTMSSWVEADQSPMTHSPPALSSSESRDPFEVQMPPEAERRRIAGESALDQSFSALSRSRSIPETFPPEDHHGPRRWFSVARGKANKGLNPDAQEFNYMPRPSTLGIDASMSKYDALNPNGVLGGHGAPSTASTLLRAFAPSPEEREALYRFRGSSNNSLERLPSLSDVGNLPASPVHGHAQSAVVEQTREHLFSKAFPSWLHMRPGKKSTFSPWADEDSTSAQSHETAPSRW